jgi:hypothetical protein
MAALSRDERDIFNVAPFDLIGRAAVPGINTLTVMLNFKATSKNTPSRCGVNLIQMM